MPQTVAATAPATAAPTRPLMAVAFPLGPVSIVQLAEERAAADHATRAPAGGPPQRPVGRDEPRAGMRGNLADQPLVGALRAGADERGALVQPFGADDPAGRRAIEDDHRLVFVPLRPGPDALDELLVAQVRPLRAPDVVRVDE